ncbi:MAG: PAS domain S-box protein [Syntrophobacteraceae bacterium]
MRTVKRKRTIIWLLRLFISGVVVVVPPGYFYISYSYISGSLASEAEINADIISRNIGLNPELWEFEHVRIEEHLARRPMGGEAETRRIFNLKNDLVAQSVSELAPPIITRSSALRDSGVVVGRIEISRSLRPLIERSGVIALINALLGLSAYLVLRALLLRSLDRAQTLVEQNQARYSAVVEDIPMLLCRFLSDGTLSFVNNAYCRYFGRTIEELLGRSFQPPVPAGGPSLAPSRLGALTVANPTETYELRVIAGNGETRWLRWIVRAIFEGGKQVEFQAIGEDITERRLAREALRESEEKYRALIETTGTGYGILDSDGRVLDANLEYVRLTGHGALEEILGRGVSEWTAPHDVARNSEAIEKCARQGFFNHLEVEYINAEQKRTPIEINATVLSTSEGLRIIALCRDISGRRQAQEALRESETKLRAIYNTVGTGIFIIDKETNRIIEANPTAAEMTGMPKERILGEVCHSFVCPAEVGKCPVKDLGQEVDHSERKLLLADGRSRDILKSVCPVIIGGRDCYVESFIDITDRKQAEEDRIKWEQRLQKLQKAESLARMAGAIAHHFNNMLGVVMGNLELAVDDLHPASEVRARITDAMNASRRAAEISRFMLTYIGQTVAKKELLDLAETIRETLPLLGDSLPKEVHLTADLPTYGPAILSDSTHLKQVLTNLILNAGEALGEGGGDITVAIRTMPATQMLGLKFFPFDWEPREDRYACLWVSDNGCGMDTATLEKIFDPFYSTKFTGRGLGLPVALGLVRAYGGSISVESRHDHGTTFQVFFPLPRPNDLPSSQEDAPVAKVADGRGLVLVVDDEPMIRSMAQCMLHRLGWEVLTARDGFEAVEIFGERKSEFRLVLLDLGMPLMDGWETLSTLRTLRPDIPVVLVSGYDEAQVMTGRHPEVPQAFLQKPYQIADLKAALDEAMEGVARGRAGDPIPHPYDTDLRST